MSERVLVVDDDASMTDMLVAGLQQMGLEVEACDSGERAFDRLERSDFDVVVTDLNMRNVDGIELCERIAANRPDVPVVVITAFGSVDTAVSAMRAGAYDFIPKPFELEVLSIAIRRAIQHHALRNEVRRLREELRSEHPHEELFGNSTSMRKLNDLIDRVAGSSATALVTGESGTGKERVARALHQRSPSRRQGPFVAIDCAALPENLLESELFGYQSGAFTDARTSRSGLFEQANTGTLFLDEIGELPLSLQPKLLRAIQERKIRPLGANREVALDARIVAATNRDLDTEVKEGRFREELYYRINVIQVAVPPLRARGSDVLGLAQRFITTFATASNKRVHGLSPAVAERLLAYSWPGNVRELENCMERAVAVARFEDIRVEDLTERVRSYRSTPVLDESHNAADLLTMEEVERRYIQHVLEMFGGNKARAARTLGLDRRTLYRKLRQYGNAR
ncbi:MAG TPA: sigma-54 dependent transcriptional regulator [Vicinamibacteria bacterium]|nr:sigma-54 dependent transcriptional regulator [Vicinamibacteria bacterium]